MARQSLAEFIQECLDEENEKQAPVKMIVLEHMKGTSGGELHQVTIGGARKYTPQELESLFSRKAQYHCQDLPGIQTYNLVVIYGDERKTKATRTFTVQGEQRPTGLTTESPDAAGFTAQAMRHSEAVMQMAFVQTRAVLEAQNETIRLLSKQNAELLQENQDAYVIVKDMIQKAALDTHQLEMERLSKAASIQERQKLLGMAPALLNTITGKKIFPDSSQDTALIEALAEGMRKVPEAKLLEMASIIPHELLGPLMARATEVIEKKKEEEAKARMVATGIIKTEGAAEAELET